MKITKIETSPIRLPTRRVHQWASLTTPIGVYVIIKLHNGRMDRWASVKRRYLKDWGGDHGKYFRRDAADHGACRRRYPRAGA